MLVIFASIPNFFCCWTFYDSQRKKPDKKWTNQQILYFRVPSSPIKKEATLIIFCPSDFKKISQRNISVLMILPKCAFQGSVSWDSNQDLRTRPTYTSRRHHHPGRRIWGRRRRRGLLEYVVPSRRFATASRQRRGTLVQSVGRVGRLVKKDLSTEHAHGASCTLCRSTKPPRYVSALWYIGKSCGNSASNVGYPWSEEDSTFSLGKKTKKS